MFYHDTKFISQIVFELFRIKHFPGIMEHFYSYLDFEKWTQLSQHWHHNGAGMLPFIPLTQLGEEKLKLLQKKESE